MDVRLYSSHEPDANHSNYELIAIIAIPDMRAFPEFVRVTEETKSRYARLFQQLVVGTNCDRYVEVEISQETDKNPIPNVSVDELRIPPDYNPGREERERCRRVLAHHDRLALAQTAGACGSVPNLVSLALRAAAVDVAKGTDYPA